jgi:hypothetical protein
MIGHEVIDEGTPRLFTRAGKALITKENRAGWDH